MVVTASALLCLTLNVYHESRGEPEAGQMAVAYVTLNRALSQNKEVCNVVYEKSQFSWTEQKVKPANRKSAAWVQAEHIAKTAVATYNKNVPLLKVAMYFHADYVRPKWAATKKKVATIGRHHFYS